MTDKEEIIKKLEDAMIENGGMALNGYEMSENDGLNKAIQIVIEHFNL